jgi:hypothetical protein
MKNVWEVRQFPSPKTDMIKWPRKKFGIVRQQNTQLIRINA